MGKWQEEEDSRAYEELKLRLTDEVLSTMLAAVEYCGWEVDAAESAQFVAWCYLHAGKTPPEFNITS